jgi:mRNA interferase MazF
LVPFPFTDLTSVKQRPALVVSSDKLNASRQDVILVAITSQVPTGLEEGEMLVPMAELAQWGLPKPSMLKLTKLFSIHQGLIRKSLGASTPATLEIILRRLQKQFEP